MTLVNFGIAVTTHNRPQFLQDCLQNIVKHSPPDIPLIVVDDGSQPPAQIPAEYNATIYRHPQPLGIPAAKNRCIEELMREDVEHLFLFDDDTYPLVDGWWLPYADGPEPHYQYNWSIHLGSGRQITEMQEVYRDPNLVGYDHSFGCMLYIHRSVIQQVGGFDTQFGMGGEEHIEFSQRVHDADLTTFVGQDVPISHESGPLFYAADEHLDTQDIRSTNRLSEDLNHNRQLRLKLAGRTSFVPYLAPRDVVITFLSDAHVDPQINKKRHFSVRDLEPLVNSVGPWSDRMVILHDCFTNPAVLNPLELHRVPTPLSPYQQRWISEYQYLRAHPEVRYAWLVDATDVQMLNDPFPHMRPDTLYSGWEGAVVGVDWVRAHSQTVSHWVDNHADEMLLNCGVVGGDRKTLMNLCRRMTDMWLAYGGDPLQETVWFNMIARQHANLVAGPKITTVYKSHNTNDPHAFWAHK